MAVRYQQVFHDGFNGNGIPENYYGPEISSVTTHSVHLRTDQILIPNLINLAFLGFVVYALVVSNTASVFDACGHSLWNFICTRFCFSITETILLFCFGILLMLALKPNSPIKGVAFYMWIVLIFHIILTGLGAFYTSEAMNHEDCRSNMTSVSATQSPLLGIMGYVYLSFDSIAIVVVLCILSTLSSIND